MAKIDIYYSKNSVNEFPSSDYVHIWTSEFSSDKQDRIFLSPELMTSNEIDHHVDKLIEELNEARSKAKNFIIKD